MTMHIFHFLAVSLAALRVVADTSLGAEDRSEMMIFDRIAGHLTLGDSIEDATDDVPATAAIDAQVPEDTGVNPATSTEASLAGRAKSVATDHETEGESAQESNNSSSEAAGAGGPKTEEDVVDKKNSAQHLGGNSAHKDRQIAKKAEALTVRAEEAAQKAQEEEQQQAAAKAKERAEKEAALEKKVTEAKMKAEKEAREEAMEEAKQRLKIAKETKKAAKKAAKMAAHAQAAAKTAEEKAAKPAPNKTAVKHAPELELPHPGQPVKSKVLLALLNVLVVPAFFGVDRCYMGNCCLGVMKGITLGGGAVWFIIDWIIVTINMLREAPSISSFGYDAVFKPKQEVWIAFLITIIALTLKAIMVLAHTVVLHTRRKNLDYPPQTPKGGQTKQSDEPRSQAHARALSPSYNPSPREMTRESRSPSMSGVPGIGTMGGGIHSMPGSANAPRSIPTSVHVGANVQHATMEDLRRGR